MHVTRRAPGTNGRARRGGPAIEPPLDSADERLPSGSAEPRGMELPPTRGTLLGRAAAWVERMHALRAAVEHARGRSGTLDATFETMEHDSDLGGGMLAGALSYRLFVFTLPLAFFVISGLGLLASAFGTQPHLISNSVGMAGVVTSQVANTAEGSSSWWVALTSFFVLIWATRGLLRSVTIVHSLAWRRSAASVKVRTHSLGIFAAALVGQLAVITGVGAVGHRTVIGGVVTLVAFEFVLAGLWLVVSLELPHSDARWTDLIPGSLVYALGFTCLLIFNAVMLGSLIQSKTSTYGALGTAATLLLAFFLLGRVIVVAAVLNSTLYARHARSRSERARPHP
jgi:uncharacterized BrkB/YihY/UPF0761 family membrane protein